MKFHIYECLTDRSATLISEKGAKDQPWLIRDSVLLHTFDAVSTNDAGRQYYGFLGFGEYKPMLDKDGNPYPEDEAPYK